MAQLEQQHLWNVTEESLDRLREIVRREIRVALARHRIQKDVAEYQKEIADALKDCQGYFGVIRESLGDLDHEFRQSRTSQPVNRIAQERPQRELAGSDNTY